MLGFIRRGASIVALSLLSSAAMAQTAPGNPPQPPPPAPAASPAGPAPEPLPPAATPPPPEMAPMPPPAGAPANELAPPPEAGERPGFHEHDGFYAHFGLGFSGYSDSLMSEDVLLSSGQEDSIQGVLTGFATVSEVAVGGTIGSGFVLGLGLWTTTALTATYTPVDDHGLAAPPAEFQRPENFAIVGPFIDWYFKPRRGVHFTAALGLATLSGLNTESPRLRDRDTAFGGGLMLGLGHEWWVAGNWGVGVLGRLTAGVVTEEDDAGVRWTHFLFAFPSMLFTATYH